MPISSIASKQLKIRTLSSLQQNTIKTFNVGDIIDDFSILSLSGGSPINKPILTDTNAKFYKGLWDAKNNNPKLTNLSNVDGDYFKIATTSDVKSLRLGVCAAGDYICFDGGWYIIPANNITLNKFGKPNYKKTYEATVEYKSKELYEFNLTIDKYNGIMSSTKTRAGLVQSLPKTTVTSLTNLDANVINLLLGGHDNRSDKNSKSKKKEITKYNSIRIGIIEPFVATPNTITTIQCQQTLDCQYSAFTNIVGGLPPYKFSVSNGALPNGVTINNHVAFVDNSPVFGSFVGAPIDVGTFNATIQVVDSTGNNHSTFDITAVVSPKLIAIPAVFPELKGESPTQSVATLSFSSVTGGVPPYHYTLDRELPGISFNTENGYVSGSITLPLKSENITGTAVLQVVDSLGNIAAERSYINYNVDPKFYASTRGAGLKENYDIPTNQYWGFGALTGKYGKKSYKYEAYGLPSELKITSYNGIIFGTPTVAGKYSINVFVTDANDIQADDIASFDINIYEPLAVDYNDAVASSNIKINRSKNTITYGGIENIAISGFSPILVSNGVPPYSYKWTNTKITELLIAANSGVISGTVGKPITLRSTITVTDSKHNIVESPTIVMVIANSIHASIEGNGYDKTVTLYPGDKTSSLRVFNYPLATGGSPPYEIILDSGSLLKDQKVIAKYSDLSKRYIPDPKLYPGQQHPFAPGFNWSMLNTGIGFTNWWAEPSAMYSNAQLGVADDIPAGEYIQTFSVSDANGLVAPEKTTLTFNVIKKLEFTKSADFHIESCTGYVKTIQQNIGSIAGGFPPYTGTFTGTHKSNGTQINFNTLDIDKTDNSVYAKWGSCPFNYDTMGNYNIDVVIVDSKGHRFVEPASLQIYPRFTAVKGKYNYFKFYGDANVAKVIDTQGQYNKVLLTGKNNGIILCDSITGGKPPYRVYECDNNGKEIDYSALGSGAYIYDGVLMGHTWNASGRTKSDQFRFRCADAFGNIGPLMSIPYSLSLPFAANFIDNSLSSMFKVPFTSVDGSLSGTKLRKMTGDYFPSVSFISTAGGSAEYEYSTKLISSKGDSPWDATINTSSGVVTTNQGKFSGLVQDILTVTVTDLVTEQKFTTPWIYLTVYQKLVATPLDTPYIVEQDENMGNSFVYPVKITGGSGSFTYTVTPELPAGLKISSDTSDPARIVGGRLTGISSSPVAKKSYSIKVHDNILGKNTPSISFYLTVVKTKFTLDVSGGNDKSVTKTNLVAAGWVAGTPDKPTPANITINVKGEIKSTKANAPALLIDLPLPDNCKINVMVNYPITGCGGLAGAAGSPGGNGGNGGPALRINYQDASVKIATYSNVSGGGGGGGGGSINFAECANMGSSYQLKGNTGSKTKDTVNGHSYRYFMDYDAVAKYEDKVLGSTFVSGSGGAGGAGAATANGGANGVSPAGTSIIGAGVKTKPDPVRVVPGTLYGSPFGTFGWFPYGTRDCTATKISTPLYSQDFTYSAVKSVGYVSSADNGTGSSPGKAGADGKVADKVYGGAGGGGGGLGGDGGDGGSGNKVVGSGSNRSLQSIPGGLGGSAGAAVQLRGNTSVTITNMSKIKGDVVDV